jgi:hypothetical protein
MLMTVANLTAKRLNVLDEITGGEGPAKITATGGARVRPLPYPFNHIILEVAGDAGNLDEKQLPVRPRDWNYRQPSGLPHLPSEEWNALVQAGTVSITFAAETGRRDQEELFLAALD